MRRSVLRFLVPLALLTATTAVSLRSPVSAAEPYEHLVGSIHEHSGYSDGWPATTPATVFASGKSFGIDFLASTEHSDNLLLPVTLNEACLGAEAVNCVGFDGANSLRKWDATQEYARRGVRRLVHRFARVRVDV